MSSNFGQLDSNQSNPSCFSYKPSREHFVKPRPKVYTSRKREAKEGKTRTFRTGLVVLTHGAHNWSTGPKTEAERPLKTGIRCWPSIFSGCPKTLDWQRAHGRPLSRHVSARPCMVFRFSGSALARRIPAFLGGHSMEDSLFRPCRDAARRRSVPINWLGTEL